LSFCGAQHNISSKKKMLLGVVFIANFHILTSIS